MSIEFTALMDQGTWELELSHPLHSVIGCFALNNTLMDLLLVIKKKKELVAKCFHQHLDIDGTHSAA